MTHPEAISKQRDVHENRNFDLRDLADDMRDVKKSLLVECLFFITSQVTNRKKDQWNEANYVVEKLLRETKK